MNNAIIIKEITKKYQNKIVLDHISFDFKKNEVLGIVGENGSGKTTLLKSIANLIKLNEGSIENDLSISFILDNNSFYPYLSGLENLSYFLGNAYNKEEVEKLVLDFNMEGYINKKFRTYSLGMKQRLALCYAFLQEKDIILLDEPTNGLDLPGIIEFKNIIKRTKENNGFMIVSHNFNDLVDLCDRILFLHRGKIIYDMNINNECIRINYEIEFFEDKDIDNATKILDYKDSIKKDNKLIISLTNEKEISLIIKRISSLSIKKVLERTNYVEEKFLEILEENNHAK